MLASRRRQRKGEAGADTRASLLLTNLTESVRLGVRRSPSAALW